MHSGKIYQHIVERSNSGQKSFALLVDPDKVNAKQLDQLIQLADDAKVDTILVGGSLLVHQRLQDCVTRIKSSLDIPVLLFPGSNTHVTPEADGLLYLSLISGRNPEFLIGQHVVSAPMIRQSGLEVISTGYMLIHGGNITTVTYMSNTMPIPSDKADIAVCTAMAGEMLGMKQIYMDAGSGAQFPIPSAMISAVSNAIDIPLWVGGGIVTPEQAYISCKHGADIIVVGNAIEKEASLITEMAAAIHSAATIS